MPVDAVLIAGPTASGKSALALALAEEIGGVIVNTDSMQIYREACILTAPPSDEEMARVPHLLYGHVSVTESYSAGRYQADAADALRVARTRGRTPIFTGGTGMYFSVLTEGIADIPLVPKAVRDATAALREGIGPKAFHAELAARDPETAARLRESDTQRMLRAYEVSEATGKPLSVWQKQMGAPVLEGLNLARFVVSPPRDVLHARINARFDAMMAQGAMEEAVALEKLSLSPTARKIIGLRDLQAVAHGTLGLDEAVEKAKAATRQYAKRQVTWFRGRMADWHWLPPGSDSNNISQILPLLA
jgi:tRNA dimethylallyltransferase